MAEVADWDPVDDNNDSAPPVGWPEGMLPSEVNNAARAMQGALRREHDRVVDGTLSLPYLPLAGGTVTGDVTVTNLHLTSTHVYFDGATGDVNTTGGPLIFADTANHVYKLGSGGGSFLFQNYAGANVATVSAAGVVTGTQLTSSGNATVTGTLTAANVTASDTVTAAHLTITGNATVVGTLTALDLTASDTVTAAHLTVTGNASVAGTLTALDLTATGTVTGAQLTSTGNIDASGYVAATGDLYGGNLHLAGATIFFSGATGAVNTTGGPLIYADTSNHVYKIGSGDGAFLFQNYAGANVANLSAAGAFSLVSVTASGAVQGATLRSTSSMQIDTTSALLGTASFGPAGAWARIDTNGTYNVSGSWLTLSDRAVKDNILPYTRGLDAILELNPVTYVYKVGSSFADAGRTVRLGLVAQDVELVMPELVGRAKSAGADVATLAPGNLVYALINAVKELTARVTVLEGGKV